MRKFLTRTAAVWAAQKAWQIYQSRRAAPPGGSVEGRAPGGRPAPYGTQRRRRLPR